MRGKNIRLLITGIVLSSIITGASVSALDNAKYNELSAKIDAISTQQSRTKITAPTLSSSYNATRTASTSSNTIGSLQNSLEVESAERKTQDEKISKSIGGINSTLTGYIGSSPIDKIGDGTLRGAIGNTSIVGIGSSNTVTSAISGLNSKIGSTNISTGTNKIGDGTLTGAVSSLNSDIATTKTKVTELQAKNKSKRIIINKNFQKTEQSYTNTVLKGKDYIDVYVWCTTIAFSRVLRVYDDTISCYTVTTGTAYSINCPIMFDSNTGTVNWVCHDYSGWTECSAWQINSIYYY